MTLIVSASQFKTAHLCIRRWYFEKVLKLPMLKAANLEFGSVFHACAERFLKGQDPFPEDWEIDEETKQRLSVADAQLVRVLVQMGIDEGVLERRHGSQVEQGFKIPIIPGVEAVGYIDHEDDAQVEDHKTSKNARYLLSSKKLLEDIQMMLYAKKKVVEHVKRGIAPPPIISLVHNQFVKDPENPIVKRTRAETTPHKIEIFFKDVICSLAEKMVKARTAKDPFELPDPEPSACNSYGGCPFMSVCSGGESIDSYRKRLTRMAQAPKTAQPMTSTSPNDFFAQRRAAKGATAPAVNSPVNPTPAAPAPAGAAAAPTAGSNPPWYSAKCALCTARKTFPGFNPGKKEPCRVCLAYSGWSSAAVAEKFEYRFEPDGTVVWFERGGAPVMTAPAPVVEVKQPVAEVIEEAPVEEAEVVEETPVEEIEVAEVAEPSPEEIIEREEAVVRRPRGRPRKEKSPEPAPAEASPALPQGITSSPENSAVLGAGLIIIVAAGMNKPFPGRVVMSAEQWLASQDGYFDNENVFQRRDAFRKAVLADAKVWEERLKNTILVQATSDPDVDAAMVTLSMLPRTIAIFAAR